MRRNTMICWLVSLLIVSQTPLLAAVDFETEIAPLFVEHCVRCHSPGNAKGQVSVATRAGLTEQDYLVPGDPDASYLIELITATDGERPEMPQRGEPLSETEVELIRRWIAAGADWPADLVVREPSKADRSWWSLQPLDPGSLSGGVDEFVIARLAAKELTLNPPADRRTLIRRASYDLHGLPPTPGEVAEFVADPSPDAFEQLIDRLLASPQYGERWGRHWLDVVRFGESNGFERNVIIDDLWPFRDYIIRSLNEDKPFDQLIREHLAGDVISKDQPDVEIGAAFLVAGPYDNVRNQDPVQAAQIRANTIDEMIRASGEAFLGLTIGCARCHDHKFDPILQQDYYALYATFAGVRHGSRQLATADQRAKRAAQVNPLKSRQQELQRKREQLQAVILQRAMNELPEYERGWQREPINRQGTEETFPPVEVKWVRLVSEGQDPNVANLKNFGIDEFEIWSSDQTPQNVALAAAGAQAWGESRVIEDFPGAYGPQKAIDGKTGERFLATAGKLVIELAAPTTIERVVFSSARGETNPNQQKFMFLSEYRIEVSPDGQSWTAVADSSSRQPVSIAHRDHRLRKLASTPVERRQLAELGRELSSIRQSLDAIPPLPTAWIGERVAEDAQGPFHIFLGGSPQRPGNEVFPASLQVFTPPETQAAKLVSADDSATRNVCSYALPADASEGERRVALADWIVDERNPLTSRVLANRVWQSHFGTGLVDTPNDFGYMGSRPTHPDLLDWLATRVHAYGWRIKPLHKEIMMSQTYQQSSDNDLAAARLDGDARLLWRFPPRRLSAEEIRDTMLVVAGQLDRTMGGPGFRMYRYLQDNVSTYVPLDEHGPATYRRAIYHQNARASVIDLMTEFDQPDCAFSAPRRVATTTPLQALTMLNHSFTLDMAEAMSQRLTNEVGGDPLARLEHAYECCYSRPPSDVEIEACLTIVREFDWVTLCRVLLNTSELVYLR